MAEEFDTTRAAREHREILGRVQAVRNLLTQDVIDYNWDRMPRSESDERKTRSDMRSYLERASADLSRVIRDL